MYINLDSFDILTTIGKVTVICFRIRLRVEKTVIATAPNDGRHVEHIEIPKDVVSRLDLSCITVSVNYYNNF